MAMNQSPESPRVSIIIPCFNTAQFASETLDSVFAQTYRDFEAIVVNDGSPDTPQLERVLSPFMERIVYIKTENQGPAGARNNGIRASRGEFIALLDSDDKWTPNYLETMVAELDQNPSVDIVYPRVRCFGEGDSRKVRKLYRGEVTFISLVQQTCTVSVSVLARRTAFERVGLFDANLRRCEDFDMWLRCLKNGSRIKPCKEILQLYRRRSDSLSANELRMYAAGADVLTKMRTAVQLTPEERQALDDAIRRFQGKKLFCEGKQAFISGNIPTAIDCLEHAVTCLGTIRLRLIILSLRTMPQFIRGVYSRRLRKRSATSLP
jgi:GT2 family glycosyltransferase